MGSGLAFPALSVCDPVMPKELGIEFPGAVFHFASRGDWRALA